MEICQQILEKIKEYDTIIIHRHMKPDLMPWEVRWD